MTATTTTEGRAEHAADRPVPDAAEVEEGAPGLGGGSRRPRPQAFGVAGDLEATPAFVRREAPRGPYPQPPGPPMYSALVFQEAAAHFGYDVHPAPEAINSQ